MDDFQSALPAGVSVPLAVPQPFNRDDEYRDYLSFRIAIQNLCTQLLEDKPSKSKLKEMIEGLKNGADRFPTMPFPSDLTVMGEERNMVVADPKSIAARVGKIFGRGVTSDEMSTCQDFADALVGLVS